MNRRPTGYTLLELVVVMAILAMTTALAAPPSYRMVRSWQESTQVKDVIEQLERLPGKVRTSGNPLTVTADTITAPVGLPQGWTLKMEEPLHVQANGACSNAQGVLTTAQQSIPLRIQAPFCRVQRIEP